MLETPAPRMQFISLSDKVKNEACHLCILACKMSCYKIYCYGGEIQYAVMPLAWWTFIFSNIISLRS